ncbi:MAG: hypothetical protein ACK5Z5_04465 [Neisseriaceae bacterium]
MECKLDIWLRHEYPDKYFSNNYNWFDDSRKQRPNLSKISDIITNEHILVKIKDRVEKKSDIESAIINDICHIKYSNKKIDVIKNDSSSFINHYGAVENGKYQKHLKNPQKE